MLLVLIMMNKAEPSRVKSEQTKSKKPIKSRKD